MKTEARTNVYRGMVSGLACAIYNNEGWDKQNVAELLRLGDPTNDYMFRGDPPERLTEHEVDDALDRIFEWAGI